MKEKNIEQRIKATKKAIEEIFGKNDFNQIPTKKSNNIISNIYCGLGLDKKDNQKKGIGGGHFQALEKLLKQNGHIIGEDKIDAIGNSISDYKAKITEQRQFLNKLYTVFPECKDRGRQGYIAENFLGMASSTLSSLINGSATKESYKRAIVIMELHLTCQKHKETSEKLGIKVKQLENENQTSLKRMVKIENENRKTHTLIEDLGQRQKQSEKQIEKYNKQKAQSQKLNRRNLIKYTGLSFVGGATLIGGGSYMITEDKWQKKYDSYKLWSTKKYNSYKLWSTILDESEKNEENTEVYEKVMKPIFRLINPIKDSGNPQKLRLSDSMEILLSLVSDTTGKNKPVSIDDMPKNYTNWDDECKKVEYPTKEAEKKESEKEEQFIYNFEGGVVQSDPSYDTEESVLIDFFTKWNTRIAERVGEDVEIKNLEEGLEKLLGINDPQNQISPMLIYGLFIEGGTIKEDKQNIKEREAYMYRFPKFVKKCSENEDECFIEPYEGYNHRTRPFFQDFLQKRSLQLGTTGSVNVSLSSVYLDYSKKTTTPIRTLMFEKEAEIDEHTRGLFLLCIDFKYNDNW